MKLTMKDLENKYGDIIDYGIEGRLLMRTGKVFYFFKFYDELIKIFPIEELDETEFIAFTKTGTEE